MIGRAAGCALLAAGLLAIGYSAWPQAAAPALLCDGYGGVPTPREGPWRDGMVQLPGGKFSFGSDRYYDEEGPAHLAQVSAFWIDVHPVTNAQFARFVAATGYLTHAERGIDKADDPSLPQHLRVPGAMVFKQGPDVLRPGWQFVPGASWRHPQGPGSDLQGLANHPVVQVALEDAQAYARWAGRRLPSEAQLEYAMRGGLQDADFSWGMTELPKGKAMANTWQGQFPYHNAATDGFTGTSPVGCFPANGFGLFDAGGNVWELTRTGYRPGHAPQRDAGLDPPGPSLDDSHDPADPGVKVAVIKGGSHLCSADRCLRYRPSARQPQPVFMATSHVGFRTVR
ncbi:MULTISPECIES: formylglycine-generating enzyme family protein [Pseudomonas]|uniref:Formylglycine-generating enzyme family protein n=1 Tax=Pseudomonas juntendi TaxID=2666183 RepID=A0A7W2M0I1_9PSED|nr:MULTISPECIES: formylglycine-generating enzyme family protein [Pseudomonas]NOY01473.1 formylglycine-generating enzyme family protein [Gammaproteobacteria bacterium]QOH69272.1 formylglycine-generating enzyme family protein [Pseudomonas putida]MBA6058032.1 formylglycine-generating enzyme family protein [Pseudomonas juntendi]MBA6126528.1 formylglycine-generating enzyme family protein [Pseudomonas juntendi]MBA6134784.1 formylglycine-generating enzyme family protein [Pseudomonas juntendi]